MKARDFTLKVVNEIEKGKFELKEFKPYMSYESFIGCILADAEILRPTGVKDKNAQMIYEGDIVDITFEYDSAFLGKGKEINRGVIIWKGYSDGEYVDNVECWMANTDPISELETKNIEIIGNIYENSALLN